MDTDGATDKVGDSAELDLVLVGQALVLVQIFGVDCLYQSTCLIRILRVGELRAVFYVVPLGEGLALLGRYCGVVYQEVILFVISASKNLVPHTNVLALVAISPEPSVETRRRG